MPTATVKGGAQHAAAHLSHAERIAAHSALSRLSSKAGGLGSHLGGITQSATLLSLIHISSFAGSYPDQIWPLLLEAIARTIQALSL